MSATPAITFGSVCSGIEAASVAWAPLGWRAVWLAEVDPFACAVLAHHYPDVPNLGDMTTIAARVLAGSVSAPDVLCGGTPCQAFSVAGLRRSLADERGNLSLKFVELANAIDHVRARSGKPASVVFWENVPGVLSTADNAFGCFLAGLAGEDEPLQPPGGRWTNAGAVYGPRRAVAWRVLDAQYFGLAQRRRRVFVVSSARAGFDPAEVLFEWGDLRRDTAPRREAGQGAAGTIGGDPDGGRISGAVTSKWAKGSGGPAGDETYNLVVHTLSARGFDASEDGTGRGVPLVPVAFDDQQITSRQNRSNPQPGGPCHTLPAYNNGPVLAYSTKLHNTASNQSGKFYAEYTAGIDANSPPPAVVAFHGAQDPDVSGDVTHPVAAQTNGMATTAMVGAAVRRMTPEECEALQGFPRGYTRVPAWDGWRRLDVGESAAQCEAVGLKVRSSKSGALWVNDPDGPRYRALGNSWPVPVVTWIGRRMARHMGQSDA